MLDKFRQAKQAEIKELRELYEQGRLPDPYEGFRPSFAMALRKKKRPAVIAEYKRASPSKGVINTALEPEDVAEMYAGAGAAALSVLTEETYFQGDLGYLERMAGPGLPLLRKDFILDKLQIARTASTRASAILLIARMCSSARELAELQQAAVFHGLDAVVEVFDQADLDMARQAQARIIQVNNRDLDTLTTDLDISARLIESRVPEEIWISASGITEPEHLARVRDLGFDAALIGTFLMQGNDPGKALADLMG